MSQKIEKWYQFGLWTHSMVLQAAEKGLLTDAQAELILNGG